MEILDFIQKYWFVFLILIIAIVTLFKPNIIEGYSLATITQITAKGGQDTYLTQDAWKYLPNKYYDGYPRDGKWDGQIPAICGNKNKGFNYYYPYNRFM